MNRAWIVMAGEYDQRHIHRVFDSREKAEKAVAEDPEYYSLDSEEGEEVR